MSHSEQLLSIAEVFELTPGTTENATWVNPGCIAVVREIKTIKSQKTGKEFFPCVLADQTGSATVECSFFTRPKFAVGDVIELAGKGLRRTEYNGNAQVSVGKDTVINIVGKSVHHAEQVQAAATGAPALNGTAQHVPGVTVGMAIKEAIRLAWLTTGMGMTRAILSDPLFWADVKQYASNIIRVSRSLENGKLTAPPWAAKPEETQAASAVAPTPQIAANAPKQARAAAPQPGPGGQAFPPSPENEEDIPF